jgi:hypothetical protein
LLGAPDDELFAGLAGNDVPGRVDPEELSETLTQAKGADKDDPNYVMLNVVEVAVVRLGLVAVRV